MEYDDEGRSRTYYKYVNRGGWGFAYFLGMIGSAVYYVQQTTTFSGDIAGLLKALVWPAFVVYRILHG
jgi:hypothetical protein